MSKNKKQNELEIAKYLMHKETETSYEPLSEYDIDRCYSKAKDIANYLNEQSLHNSDEYDSDSSWDDMGD